MESRLAICEANCLLRSSLYLAIRRSEMVFEPEPKVEKMKKLINDQIFKKIYISTQNFVVTFCLWNWKLYHYSLLCY